MFRESSADKQSSFFDTLQLIAPKMQERLLSSWAQTFRQEVLARIPEKVFAALFSEIDSRPNASIKVIMGGEILKAGFGWTDEELADHLEFDLLTRLLAGVPVRRVTPHADARRIQQLCDCILDDFALLKPPWSTAEDSQTAVHV